MMMMTAAPAAAEEEEARGEKGKVALTRRARRLLLPSGRDRRKRSREFHPTYVEFLEL